MTICLFLHSQIVGEIVFNDLLIIGNISFQLTNIGIIPIRSGNQSGVNPPLNTGRSFITGLVPSVWQSIHKAATLIVQGNITSNGANNANTHISVVTTAICQENILLGCSTNAGTTRIIIKRLLACHHLQALFTGTNGTGFTGKFNTLTLDTVTGTLGNIATDIEGYIVITRQGRNNILCLYSRYFCIAVYINIDIASIGFGAQFNCLFPVQSINIDIVNILFGL